MTVENNKVSSRVRREGQITGIIFPMRRSPQKILALLWFAVLVVSEAPAGDESTVREVPRYAPWSILDYDLATRFAQSGFFRAKGFFDQHGAQGGSESFTENLQRIRKEFFRFHQEGANADKTERYRQMRRIAARIAVTDSRFECILRRIRNLVQRMRVTSRLSAKKPENRGLPPLPALPKHEAVLLYFHDCDMDASRNKLMEAIASVCTLRALAARSVITDETRIRELGTITQKQREGGEPSPERRHITLTEQTEMLGRLSLQMCEAIANKDLSPVEVACSMKSFALFAVPPRRLEGCPKKQPCRGDGTCGDPCCRGRRRSSSR